MANILSQNDIILNLLEIIRISQPNLSLNPGSVMRDVAIEAPAAQMARLYESLGSISSLQSLRYVVGSDLDALLSNYGLKRRTSTRASGIAVCTFASLPAPIAINVQDLIFASNGFSFTVVNGITVDPVNANLYRSIATKYKNDLDFLNITDPYAVEITVKATSPGTSGNIPKYSINKTNTPSVSHITNMVPFSGATDQEDDNAFRNRGLAIFSGSSTGTVLGYRNTALSNSSVIDALVIEPGDPLMTRDGTISVKNSDGSYTIISEGTGNKVDVIILGQNLESYTDSFIYQDKSNSNDPTNSKNVFTLGQISGDEGKTINRRKIDDFKSGSLPAQPVQELVQVSGSQSGTFVEKTTDIYGRVSGNYELIKDSGFYAGSPFSFDKMAWASNKISLFAEDQIKNKFNGQDNLSYTDVLEIPRVEQNISITNENSSVIASDRSIIQLLHTPATNVTRIFNVNTGERYVITNQNIDGNSSINATGRVRISGNTLPTTSDVLQVDYLWVVTYDPFSDYDGKIITSNIRAADDSIDFGLSNAIRNEKVLFIKNSDGAFYTGTVSHPVSSIVSANLFNQTNSTIVSVSTGNFTGRLAINLNSLPLPIDNISNISLQNSTLEIYSTADNDGLFINQRTLVNFQIRYNTQIILPTDTPAEVGDSVSVFYNQSDAFNVSGSLGNYNANTITIPATNFSQTDSSIYLRVNYFANVQDALSQSITNLPVSRSGNSFNINSNLGFVNSSIANSTIREIDTIQLNGSNQPSISLNLPVADYSLTLSNVISIVSIDSHKELWNEEHPGTIDASGTNYSLVFSGFNSPTVGDNVLVIYSAVDIKRTQPFTFGNSFIRKSIQTIHRDGTTGKLFLDINVLTSDSVSFSIIDPSTSLSVGTGTGVLSVAGANTLSSSINLANISELTSKRIQITSATQSNNVGNYSIVSYDAIGNTLNIENNISNINSNQVSIIRLSDNKELFTGGSIDLISSRFILPDGSFANENDTVILSIFIANNLRQAPSRLSITVSDQINNTGIITIAGNTITKVSTIFTATSGLKQDLSGAIKKALAISSSSSIPSTISIARVVQVQKVSTVADGTVDSILFDYDILGTAINNNIFYANETIDNDSLSKLSFQLPATINNNVNIPQIGDQLQITFYYSNSTDTESVAFTRNGTLYTNKQFAFIDRIYISSGFSSTSARFVFSYLNQPTTGSRYRVYYDYTAPKQNERIIINYNYNRLISDTSIAIENNRPVNADVLVKAAREILVNITMNVVIKTSYLSSSALVLQNLQDALSKAISTNKLNDILDSSDLVSVAQGIDGIDRARVLYFNQDGAQGSVLSLYADRNQYFTANVVSVAQESR